MNDASVINFPWNSSIGLAQCLVNNTEVSQWSGEDGPACWWNVMNYLYKGCCLVLQTSWIRNLVPFTPRVCYEEYTSLDQNGVEEDFIQSVGNLDRSTSWCSDACSFRKMNSCSFLCSWTVINDLQVTVGRIEYRTTVGPISQICQWVPTHPGPRDAFWKTKTIKYMFFSDDKFEKPVVFYFHIFF